MQEANLGVVVSSVWRYAMGSPSFAGSAQWWASKRPVCRFETEAVLSSRTALTSGLVGVDFGTVRTSIAIGQCALLIEIYNWFTEASTPPI